MQSSMKKVVRWTAIVVSGAALVLAMLPVGLFSMNVDNGDDAERGLVSLRAGSSGHGLQFVVGTPFGTLRLTLGH